MARPPARKLVASDQLRDHGGQKPDIAQGNKAVLQQCHSLLERRLHAPFRARTRPRFRGTDIERRFFTT